MLRLKATSHLVHVNLLQLMVFLFQLDTPLEAVIGASRIIRFYR